MPEPKDKPEEKGNLPDPVMDVLKDLQEKVTEMQKPPEVKPPAPTVPDWRAQREADRKALGFTEEQMAAHERTQVRMTAPIIERTAWTTIEKKADIEIYRKEIEEELANYRQESKTPELMEKVYYMVRGKHADSKPNTPPTPNKGPNVERTRVSSGPGYNGAEPGMSGGRDEQADAPNEELDDREKFVAQKMGISEKDYAKSRNVGRNIRDLKPKDDRPVQSLADIELKRMSGRR